MISALFEVVIIPEFIFTIHGLLRQLTHSTYLLDFGASQIKNRRPKAHKSDNPSCKHRANGTGSGFLLVEFGLIFSEAFAQGLLLLVLES